MCKESKKREKNYGQTFQSTPGLRPKWSTFKKSLAELKPSVFLVEETKYKDEGKLRIDGNYNFFESVRKFRDEGGGLALGCH